MTSYSPLGSDNSPLLSNPVITKIAEKYKIAPAAVLVSFQANHPKRTGTHILHIFHSLNRTLLSDVLIPLWRSLLETVLPKSVTPSRIAANVELVELTPEELSEITAIGDKAKFRVCDPNWAGWGDLGFDLSSEKTSS